MLDTLKVRIYPNKGQQEALAKSFGCSRFVWNYYLNKTNNQYQETGKSMSYCDMAKDLTQLKKLTDFEGIKILSTNTVGHTEFQACGEEVRLVNTCVKKHSSVKQESPVTA